MLFIERSMKKLGILIAILSSANVLGADTNSLELVCVGKTQMKSEETREPLESLESFHLSINIDTKIATISNAVSSAVLVDGKTFNAEVGEATITLEDDKYLRFTIARADGTLSGTDFWPSPPGADVYMDYSGMCKNLTDRAF